MAVLTYMQRRRSGIYEFRKRLPRDLAGKPVPAALRVRFPELVNPATGCFKTELTISLGTSDTRLAKRKDLREAARIADMVVVVQAALADPSVVETPSTAPEEIAADIVTDWLKWDEAQREDGDARRDFYTQADRERWPDLAFLTHGPGSEGMEPDHFLAYGDFIEEEAEVHRKALASRNTATIEPELKLYLAQKGQRLPEDELKRRRLLLRALQAKVEVLDRMRARQRGDLEVELPMPFQRGPKLSEAFERWKVGGEAKGARKPGANTVLEANQAVARFIEWHGDLRLGDITKAKARDFRDALAKVPAALPNKLRVLPLRSLLQRDLSKFTPRSATTVNKLLTILAAIVSHAQRDGLLDAVPGFSNPFEKDVKFRIDARQVDPRKIFTASDLAAIFGTSIFTAGDRPKGGGGEAAFWFPLISLFSGLRLEEIAGLVISDLVRDEETGRWFFDVTPANGREVKTASSIRCVPVHRELERIGLLVYREARLKDAGALDATLWPDLVTVNEGKRSGPWSKWFGRFLRRTVGITDELKVFHSFRHTFKRMARDKVAEELHDALTGHAGRGVGRSYGRGVSFAPLVEAIDKLEAPSGFDLSNLRWRP